MWYIESYLDFSFSSNDFKSLHLVPEMSRKITFIVKNTETNDVLRLNINDLMNMDILDMNKKVEYDTNSVHLVIYSNEEIIIRTLIERFELKTIKSIPENAKYNDSIEYGYTTDSDFNERFGLFAFTNTGTTLHSAKRIVDILKDAQYFNFDGDLINVYYKNSDCFYSCFCFKIKDINKLLATVAKMNLLGD